MSFGLSPQNEHFLEQAVARGYFPSKEAALDAAVTALRRHQDEVPEVPEEHARSVDEGLDDLATGGSHEMTPADWRRLREFARDVASDHDAADR